MLEQYADNEQALAHIQNRQALLQGIREQGIEAVKTGFQQAQQQAQLVAEFQQAAKHFTELGTQAQQAEQDVDAQRRAVEAGEALLAPAFAELPHINWTVVHEMLANSYNMLANSLDAQNEQQAAVIAYTQAIELQPEVAMYRRNRTGALIALGRLEEATEELARARDLEPDAPRLADLERALEQARES